MIRKGIICVLMFLFSNSISLLAQYETLLIRFSPNASPLSVALGGLGTTLYNRPDGLFYNPSLAATLKTSTMQLFLGNDVLAGHWPTQVELDSQREVVFDLSGTQRGGRSVNASIPWQLQNLTLAISGGWMRYLPYGMSGHGSDSWFHLQGELIGSSGIRFQGLGAQDCFWLGAAVADQEYWGIGVSVNFWMGEGQWLRQYESNMDDGEWTTHRREKIGGGFWTVGAFFKPIDMVLITASLQSRTSHDLLYSMKGDNLPAEMISEEEYSVPVKIPETLIFGLCLGPIFRTSLHAEYYTKFWSQATLIGHPMGALFPSMELGLNSQQNAVLFSVGVSHQVDISSILNCTLAAGLGWEQPIFSAESGEALVLHRLSLGATMQVGSYICFSAAYRSAVTDWFMDGRFNPEKQYLFSFTRATFMLGLDFYPTGKK